MEAQFGWLYEKVLGKLKDYLKTDHVHYRTGHRPFFRIMTGEETADPTVRQVMSELTPPAHYDVLWENVKWPDSVTSFNNTISFTLTLALPKGGHGLQVAVPPLSPARAPSHHLCLFYPPAQIYHKYRDPITHKLFNYDGAPSPYTSPTPTPTPLLPLPLPYTSHSSSPIPPSPPLHITSLPPSRIRANTDREARKRLLEWDHPPTRPPPPVPSRLPVLAQPARPHTLTRSLSSSRALTRSFSLSSTLFGILTALCRHFCGGLGNQQRRS
jgi:hypothetical protein